MTKNQSIDNVDKKILYELDCNSRQPSSKIAKKLRISRDVVNYRIKKLVDSGIITKFIAIVNPIKFGYYTFKTYLKLENKKDRIDNFVQFLCKDKFVWWVATCDGKWDLIFAIFAKDVVDAYNKELELLKNFHDIIISKENTTMVDLKIYRKGYLANKSYKTMFYAGKPDDQKLKEEELELLKLIANNARMPIVEMAKLLKSTPMKVIYKLKDFEKRGIVLGYRLLVDLNNLNKEFFKNFIYLKNLTPERENSLITFCSRHHNIVYYIRGIGSWQLELEFEVDSFQHYNKIMDEIRERFSDIIRNVEFILVKKEYKYIWMPESY